MKRIIKKSSLQSGFSMIELLVTLTLLGILFVILLLVFQTPIARAKDARAKRHLNDLKVAFEEYYNDNYCYPPTTWFDEIDDCGSDQFAPYIDRIECDPSSNLPYYVELDGTGCDWFRIYTNLEIPDEELYVYDGSGIDGYNYGISSSNTWIKVNPEPEEQLYYCQAIDNCSSYNSLLWDCTPNYSDENCSGACASHTGSCVWIGE